MLLLAAFPTSWCPFITTQALVVGLTIEKLISRILQEDAMRSNSTSSSAPLLTAQYLKRHPGFKRKPFCRFPTTNSPNNTLSPKICRYCGCHGHMEKECRTKRRDQQRNKGRPKAHVQQLEDPTLGNYGMGSLQLFNSLIV
ncbi:hypothetical protein GOP47_0029820 [Adiantum capillus-veneris]|nr:hypothetical protein GOP47_0029820 [Adiantum capillus-veneris]